MKPVFHAIAGTAATLIVTSFLTTTIVSELFFGPMAVAAVKQAIAWSLVLFIPVMAATGASGASLARSRSGAIVERKKKRMLFIAMNGLLVLAPAAIFLHVKASAGNFDTVFYVVQAMEVAAGGTQLSLLILNMRDGLRLSGKLKKARRQVYG